MILRVDRPSAPVLLAASDGDGVWDGIVEWLRETGLTIVVILAAALVITKIVSYVAKRQSKKFREQQRQASDPRTSTVGAHQQALIGALRWAINFAIVFMAVIWVLIELNLPSSAVVPLASVVGAGLGSARSRSSATSCRGCSS